jgi:hypothetical protein
VPTCLLLDPVRCLLLDPVRCLLLDPVRCLLLDPVRCLLLDPVHCLAVVAFCIYKFCILLDLIYHRKMRSTAARVYSEYFRMQPSLQSELQEAWEAAITSPTGECTYYLLYYTTYGGGHHLTSGRMYVLPIVLHHLRRRPSPHLRENVRTTYCTTPPTEAAITSPTGECTYFLLYYTTYGGGHYITSAR